MERPKMLAAGAAGLLDKRKKMEETKESRIDAKQVIDDLIKSANLEHDENAEGIIKPPNIDIHLTLELEIGWLIHYFVCCCCCCCQRPGCS